MRAILSAIALGAALSGTVRTATAQSTPDAVLAETLYKQGRDLMAAGKASEACPKFAESQRLDPATGTLLNLAACYEAVGKLASAWLAYTDAAVAARRDQREDRVHFAEEHISALEPRLSRLTVNVSAAADVPGLEVRLNDAVLGPASRGVPSPVDPGSYRIEARAPGKKAWTKQITIGREPASQVVTVAALEVDPNAGKSAAPSGALVPAEPVRDRLVTERPLTGPIYVAGAVTLALAAASTATGVVFWQRKNEYDDKNSDPAISAHERENLRDRAHSMSVVSTALTGATLAGAGVTLVLFFTRPERTRSEPVGAALSRVSPFVADHGGGLVFTGRL